MVAVVTLPGMPVAGKATAACKSAIGVAAPMLLAAFGSATVLVVVAVTPNGPLPGAVNVMVMTALAPEAKSPKLMTPVLVMVPPAVPMTALPVTLNAVLGPRLV